MADEVTRTPHPLTSGTGLTTAATPATEGRTPREVQTASDPAQVNTPAEGDPLTHPLMPRRLAYAEHARYIHCDLCDAVGSHLPDCVDARRMPVVVHYSEAGTLEYAQTDTATYRNQAAERDASNIFVNAELAPFVSGRALFHHTDPASGALQYHWQRFPPQFEQSLLTPVQASTPLRGTTSSDTSLPLSSSSTAVADYSLALANQSSVQIILSNIPKFDGEPRNFPAWKQSIDQGRASLNNDKLFLQVIKQKLTAGPRMFVSGLGPKADSVDSLLDELHLQYDEFSQPFVAVTKLQNIKQGSTGLLEHHALIYQLIAGMKKDIYTKDSSICTQYIRSLQNPRIQRKLMSRLQDPESPPSLNQLMNLATKEMRVDNMTSNLVGSNTVTATVAHADVPVKRFRPSNAPREDSVRAGNKYCDIHQTPGHNTNECRDRMRTECRHCQAVVPEGQYAAHIPVCPARRCHFCKRLGHLVNNCHKALRQQEIDRAAAPASGRTPSKPAGSTPFKSTPSSSSKPHSKFRSGSKRHHGVAVATTTENDSEDSADEQPAPEVQQQVEPNAE